MNCDHCDSTNVAASVEDVRPHGKRAVFRCEECGLTWINTEPSVVEQIIVALDEGRNETGP